MLERTDDMFPCWYIWSLRPRGNGVCSRLIQLSSAESLRFFISFLDSPSSLERTSTGVTLTFSMEWLYLMKWSYKKFLYLRLELFLILNEWLRKRPFKVWDVSPTYWAPQPLAFHVITYIRLELFQSVPLSILMPYLLPLMEDMMIDSHEIWWHVKHLVALHVDILENLLLMRFERRKDFAVRTEFEIDGDLESGEPKLKGRKCNFRSSKQLFTRNSRKMKCRYRRQS